MSTHAKLSPSSADMWMTCAGSVVLSKNMPQQESEFAKEDTYAHELAEGLMLGHTLEDDVPAEMLPYLRVYVEHVNSLFPDDSAKKFDFYVGQQVGVSEVVWGTTDAIVWVEESKTLYVRDLKYDAGLPVEVEGNTQLKIYALASLFTLGYSAKTVDIGIVQPRCHHPSKAIRYLEFDSFDLIEFNYEIDEAVKRVRIAESAPLAEIERHLNPTEKGCRLCPAAPICPKIKAKAQQLAKVVFAPDLPYDPKQLSDTLDFLPIAESWAKNVREFAYNEAQKGNSIPAYKLVNKRATRKWRDEEQAEAMLSELIEPEQLVKTERKLISPAEAEKLLEKDQRAVLATLAIAESFGHTLVHESDKREAISIKESAKEAFS